MRTSLLALLFVPVFAFGDTRVETGVVQQPVLAGGGIRLTVPDVQPETSAWQRAVIANGGSYNAADVRAVDYFVRECKAKGIWSSLDWVALFAGRNLNAALVPLKRTVGNLVITNNNFVETDFLPSLGLSGGFTKHLLPGLNQNQSRAPDNVSFGVCITAVGTIGAVRCPFAEPSSVGQRLQLVFSSGGSDLAARINHANTVTMTRSQVFVGVFGGSRIPSQGASFCYVNGGENSVAQTPGIANSVLYLFSRGLGDYYNGTLGGAWFGGGLTAQQRTDFNAIWSSTMAIFGRPTS